MHVLIILSGPRRKSMSHSTLADGRNKHDYPVIFSFIFAKIELLAQCISRILPEASKIARDLFLIKLSTSEGLVCLLTHL